MSDNKIKLYRPSTSTSTEGLRFWADWCAKCAHDKVMNGSVVMNVSQGIYACPEEAAKIFFIDLENYGKEE